MARIPTEYSGRFFFHFTHIENLDSIVKNGLLSTNSKTRLNINHMDVASESIQERRRGIRVSCGKKGFVHDYVPFYLCSVNPMFLSLLYSKNIDQMLMVILAIPIERIEKDDVVFSDASANTIIRPNFYDDPNDLTKLPWSSIDNRKWGTDGDTDRHNRMAEVLIYEKVEIDEIESIIVWNSNVKTKVSQIFEENNISAPNISYGDFKGKYNFFFTKFMFKGRKNETLVTGPRELYRIFEETTKSIIKERHNNVSNIYNYANKLEFLRAIKEDFCCIPELKNIHNLETVNEIHSDNVSNHTLKVVENVKKSEYYKNANTKDQRILQISAYLHDIGKGPKEMWKDELQKPYPDHPVDSLKMLKRILTDEIKDLSEYEIRMICLLVGYHDLIGEIFGKDRKEEQLIKIIDNEKEFDMLSTLNFADVLAISSDWARSYTEKIERFKKKIFKDI